MDNILELIIKARDEASDTLKKVGGSIDEAQKKASDMSKNFKAAGAIITGAGIAGVAMMKDWTNAASEAQVEMAKVDSIVKAVADGNQTAFTNIKKYVDEAAASYVQLGFDDETTALSFAKLFQSTMDTNEANKLLAVSADLARYKNVDLGTATTAVLKATQGSTKELKAMGVELKDGATATENIATLQGIVAGQSEAFSNTYAGAMERMKIKTANLKEQLGDRLIPIVTNVVDKIGSFVDKLNAINPSLLDTIVKVTAFGTAFALIAGPILMFIGFLPAIGAGLSLLFSPITLIVAGVALLAAGVFLLIQNWGKVTEFFTKLWADITKIFNDAVAWLGQMVLTIITAFLNFPLMVAQAYYNFFFVTIPYYVGYIIGFLSTAIPQLVENVIAWFAVLPERVGAIWQAVKDWVVQKATALWTWIKTEIPTWPGKIYDFIKSIPDKVSTVFQSAKEFAIQKMNDMLDGVSKIWDGIRSIFDGIINKAKEAWEWATKAFKSGNEAGKVAGSRAIGGWIDQTAPYLMHAGEFVLSKNMLSGTQPIPTSVLGSLGGGQSVSTYNQPINVYATVNNGMDVQTLAYQIGYQLRNR